MLGEVMEFQLSYLKILKNEAVKVLHSIFQQIWKTQQWTQCWKISLFIPIQKKGNSKECSNYHIIALISHVSKVMFKILQAKLQHSMNWKLLDVQTGLRNQKSNCQHPLDHKERESQKIFRSASLTMLKPFTVWTTTNCGKFLRKWEYQIALPVSWKICM